MSKIILIENESIRVEVNKDDLRCLAFLDEYDVKELFECAKEATCQEEIQESISDCMCEFLEGTLSVYEHHIWDHMKNLSYYEFLRLEDRADLGLEEFRDVISYYRYLLWMKNEEDASDDLYKIYRLMDIIDLEDEEFDFDELDEDIQEEIRENEEMDYKMRWDNVDYWSEYYIDLLREEHPIFNNLNIYEFDLSGCQGDFIDFDGYITIKDLKEFIFKYKSEIFSIFDRVNTKHWWNTEDKKNFIKAILRMNDTDYVKVNKYNRHSTKTILYTDVFVMNDDYNRDTLTEEFVECLIDEIECQLRHSAKIDIDNFIDCEFEDYFNNIFIVDYKFDRFGHIL